MSTSDLSNVLRRVTAALRQADRQCREFGLAESISTKEHFEIYFLPALEKQGVGLCGSHYGFHGLVPLLEKADERFGEVGGGTRHYVRDCLFPLMEEAGMFFYVREETTP